MNKMLKMMWINCRWKVSIVEIKVDGEEVDLFPTLDNILLVAVIFRENDSKREI
jgi:hypothetical protein